MTDSQLKLRYRDMIKTTVVALIETRQAHFPYSERGKGMSNLALDLEQVRLIARIEALLDGLALITDEKWTGPIGSEPADQLHGAGRDQRREIQIATYRKRIEDLKIEKLNGAWGFVGHDPELTDPIEAATAKGGHVMGLYDRAIQRWEDVLAFLESEPEQG